MSAAGDLGACRRCGATIQRSEARYCSSCGARLPAGEGSPAPRPAASTDETEEERLLEALASGPEGRSLASSAPPSRLPSLRDALGGTLSFLLVLGAGLVLTLATLFFFPPLALVPLALSGLVLFALVTQWLPVRRRSDGPLVWRPARILSCRARIAGERDSSTTTLFSVILRLEGGARLEVRCGEELAVRIAEGDLGLACTRDERLVDFRAVPLPPSDRERPGRREPGGGP